MENDYKVNGEVAVIILRHKKKDWREDVVLIDAVELPKLLEFKGRFHPYVHPRTGKLYARGYYKDPVTKKISQPLLHRLIMEPTRGQNTMHINEDTLLCTRFNMRNVIIGTSQQDLMDLIQAEQESLRVLEETASPTAGEVENETFLVHETTTAGVWLPDLANLSEGGLKIALDELKAAGKIEKGVSFHKQKRRWEVSAFHEGVRHRLGYWPPVDLERANKAVKLFRDVGPVDYFAGVGKGGTF